MKPLLVFAALLFALPAHAEVTFDWITVGDPGNAADPDTGFGAVAYTYQISRFEVSNAQYTEFLNAVAATDTYNLYNTSMGSDEPSYRGGITRGGSSGSYTYSAIAGREDMPVNHVSWYDALRFANWLHNGQPTGEQDGTTTEDGAYDMSLESSVVRKAGAQAFLTSEDEWYKAAYYAGSDSYYDYPAGSDTQTTCAVPGATANTANCDVVVGDLTDAGSYTGSASPNGTFDQGGNVWEWNEALIGSDRGLRGGGYNGGPHALAVSYRSARDPAQEYRDLGFRAARPRATAMNWSGTARVLWGDFPEGVLTGGGVALVNSSRWSPGGVVPANLNALVLPTSRGQFGGTFTRLVTDPVTIFNGIYALHFEMQLENREDRGPGGDPFLWNGISGGAASTSTGNVGRMPVGGLVKVCLLSTVCTQYLPLVLSQPTTVNGVPGTGTKGPGLGGLITASGYAGIRISLQGAPWTIKTATVIDQITPTGGPPRIFTIWTAKGWAHAPASTTTGTAQPSGVVQLVTPGQIMTNLPLGSSQKIGSFVIVTIRFIPEPGLLLLLASGVAGLILIGRRRVRR